MALTPEQRKQWNAYRRAGKTKKAAKFRQNALQQNAAGTSSNGTAPSPSQTPINVNPQDPNSVLNEQDRVNRYAERRSTPNVSNPYGDRDLIDNGDGTFTAKTTLSEPMQKEFSDQRDFRSTQTEGAQKFGNQAINQGAFTPTSYQDPRTAPAQMSADPRQGLNRFGIPQDYQGHFDNVYKTQMARFKDATKDQFAQERERTLQGLVQAGHGRGSQVYEAELKRLNEQENSRTLAASADAINTAGREQSRMYGNTLQGRGQMFGENLQAGNQQFGQQFQNAQQQFGQNFQTNQQRFGQEYDTYQIPFQSMQAFAPNAGQYTDPNFGALQQIGTTPTDLTNYSASVLGEQGATARQRLANDTSTTNARISAGASLGAAQAGAGATLGAARIRNDGALQQQNNQQRIDQENAAYQFGLGF